MVLENARLSLHFTSTCSSTVRRSHSSEKDSWFLLVRKKFDADGELTVLVISEQRDWQNGLIPYVQIVVGTYLNKNKNILWEETLLAVISYILTHIVPSVTVCD